MILEQEQTVDVYQKNIFLDYLNKELKNKIRKLELQREIFVNALSTNISNKSTVTPIRHFSLRKCCLIIITGILISIAFYYYFLPHTETAIRSKYLIEDLRGDTVETWKLWKLDKESTLVVNIVNSDLIDERKLKAIKNAILSTEEINIDDSITHKGLAGTRSTYFVGWKGALQKAAETKTDYSIPFNFKIIETDSEVGNIIITLSTAKDQDGYSGFTKSVVEGNEILKSHITIYDVDSLSDEMLEVIIRHEFGHALGLGHSTAPEDLMAPTISMLAPYISACDIDAIKKLYDGMAMNNVVCEK